ncbi:MAG: ribosome silencing factor [Marinilabiliaceae bacterium]|jgi:ribosome-associated protein|nr:ribosome silencing factor [Bacteroidales bacterium]MCR5695904.1 ribosome silencing factor [Marinilabiliaceae bacterium]
MAKRKDPVLEAVVAGIQDKKGKNITVLDMKGVDASICDYFVICEGNSNTQVDAIADSVWDKVHEDAGEKPLHDEGRENCMWILLDYGNVIVHIFQRDAREFYSLESLWSDAKRTDIPDID